MKNLWTDEEIALFEKGLSNEEIAKITGRTSSAVRMKRCRLYKEDQENVDYAKVEKRTKIKGLKAMAKRLGVKLFGK